MSWPKEWLECAENHLDEEECLDALHEIGALKDPPKPREFVICNICMRCMPGCGHAFEENYSPIRVREVEEDDES